MASSLTWLDSSRAEERRMRELLAMFSSSDTVDDLGIGQIRDTFSDLLFPGTSVLLTRAKYLLIVPWCYMVADRRSLTGKQYEARVERYEREFIKYMKDAGAPPGLIGRDSGPLVKRLPSTLYWNALGTYGIRLADGPIARGLPDYDGTGELTDRHAGMWHSTTPQPPKGFPGRLEDGLDLTRSEAAWLQDRILGAVRDSLLGEFLLCPDIVNEDAEFPWTEPNTAHISAGVRHGLEHARLFSGAIHGAHLLYNLLIAESFQRAGVDRLEGQVDHYLEALREWSSEVSADPAYRRWDLDDFWGTLIDANPRVGANRLARHFVTGWLTAVIQGEVQTDDAAGFEHAGLRALVADRERTVKQGQARLSNQRRLKSWNGASGAGRLEFRWTQVRRIIRDIQLGVETGKPDAAA